MIFTHLDVVSPIIYLNSHESIHVSSTDYFRNIAAILAYRNRITYSNTAKLVC